jgi:hypothetical protein
VSRATATCQLCLLLWSFTFIVSSTSILWHSLPVTDGQILTSSSVLSLNSILIAFRQILLLPHSPHQAAVSITMPSIGDIHIELQCQQGVRTGGPIPEFAPRRPGTDDPDGQFMPRLYDSATRTCSVFIPVFPSAHFFLTFDTKPIPNQPTQFYVLRFFIGNDEISTWHCGPEDGFKGCMMFALFDTSKTDVSVSGGDGKGLEKRVFMFGDDTRVVGDLSAPRDEDRKIEVQVFRASEKLRSQIQNPRFANQGMNHGLRYSIRLTINQS